MNLSARDLRAVIALVEERSFTRAAERVHLSQPAFSALIQGVEDSLGARLFDRTTRNVALTAEGKLFESSARRVLSDLEGMVSNFREHALRRRGRVAIAALPSLAAGWLPDVLAEFRKKHPGIELALHDALADQCKVMLRARQVDLALTTVEEQDSDLRAEILCTDEFHLVCRSDHPLAQQSVARLEDLAQYPFVHLSRNTSVRHHLDLALQPARIETVLEVEHLATVAGLVQAGLGISVVPALTLFHFRRPDLVLRKLKVKGLKRVLHVVQRKNEALSLAAQALRELLMLRRPGTTPKPRQRGKT